MAITDDVHYEVDPAPPVLELDDHEKFIDSNGKVLNIEGRGERNFKKCYFKVIDVSREFEMDIKATLFQKETSYENNIHFKTFTVSIGKSLKKTLFMTYQGMNKLISFTRNQFITCNSSIISLWLHGIVTKNHTHQYILKNPIINKSGMIYIVTSPLFNAVKIGLWSGYLKGLESRYRMAYGQDIQIVTKNVDDVYTAEKHIHKKFIDKCISGELFLKTYINEYISYLKLSI
jgi:hypothetical protein